MKGCQAAVPHPAYAAGIPIVHAQHASQLLPTIGPHIWANPIPSHSVMADDSIARANARYFGSSTGLPMTDMPQYPVQFGNYVPQHSMVRSLFIPHV